jgi:hypothetical protein
VLFIAGVALGVVTGIVVLLTVGRTAGTAARLGRWTLVFGAVAAVSFVATGLIRGPLELALVAGLASIALAFAGMLVGVGAVLRRVRQWQIWVGLFLAGAPALMWLSIFMTSLQQPP